MNWLALRDRLLGRPNIDNFAREVAARLHAKGMGPLTYFRDKNELRTDDGGTFIFLGNGFADYQRASRANRAGVLARFVNGLATASHEDDIPSDYAQARLRLLPIVRGEVEDALARLHVQRSTDQAPRDHRPANRPFASGLTIGLAYDMPNAIRRLTMDQLTKWGVDLEHALADAIENLRTLPEHGGWQPLDHGVWSGAWGDDYEASRLLLPDLIHRLGVPEPVVLAPLRNMLLLTSARNEAGIAEMARLAEQALQERPRWLSVRPLRLNENDKWEEFVPPASSAAAFHDLHLKERADVYASQKAALDEVHARDGTDIFVASVMLFRGKDDGHLRSYGTWSNGVDTLLPVTDMIAFARHDGGNTRTVVARWDVAASIVGSLLEATEHQPVRYRVRSFPDAHQWAALAEHGVSP